jgi:spore coat protein CotH
MKKMTCMDMGGACEMEFVGTAEEIMKAGGEHIESTTDEAHAASKAKMMEAMNNPEMMAEWDKMFAEKFAAAPEAEASTPEAGM